MWWKRGISCRLGNDVTTLWALRTLAALAAGIVVLIVGFLVMESLLALRSVGLLRFVTDPSWHPVGGPAGGSFNLWPMIIGTTALTGGATVLDPEVILLDEPCSALDPIASGVVEDMIAALRGRYTTVIVTHNLAQARRIADDVAMFWVTDGVGTLIEHGAVAKVFDGPDSGITAAYVRGARG